MSPFKEIYVRQNQDGIQVTGEGEWFTPGRVKRIGEYQIIAREEDQLEIRIVNPEAGRIQTASHGFLRERETLDAPLRTRKVPKDTTLTVFPAKSHEGVRFEWQEYPEEIEKRRLAMRPASTRLAKVLSRVHEPKGIVISLELLKGAVGLLETFTTVPLYYIKRVITRK